MKVNSSTILHLSNSVNSVVKTVEHSSEKIASRPDLPRFSSPEMIMARTLNKIALREVKNPKTFNFQKATKEDLKRLTSNTIEDSYSRVTWTNPKDSKIYHILKEKELDNGNISVRILNEDGSFLKNAEVKPKKIVIIDDFNDKSQSYGLTHGEMVSTFAKRHNPFAKVETIDVGMSFPHDSKYIEAVESLNRRVNNGEQIDFVSCSNGAICYTTDKRFRNIPSELDSISNLANGKTRVLYSSGNSINDAAKTANNVLLTTRQVEGVGSISPNTHKISDFSASRNSYFTQHYECGEYHFRPTSNGVNITGLSGTDLVIKDKNFNERIQYNPVIGKSKERVDKCMNKIKEEIDNVYKEKSNLFKGGRIDFAKLKKLEERLATLERRKIKLNNYCYDSKLENGVYEAPTNVVGTSFSTPIRAAKLSLNEMFKDIV